MSRPSGTTLRRDVREASPGSAPAPGSSVGRAPSMVVSSSVVDSSESGDSKTIATRSPGSTLRTLTAWAAAPGRSPSPLARVDESPSVRSSSGSVTGDTETTDCGSAPPLLPPLLLPPLLLPALLPPLLLPRPGERGGAVRSNPGAGCCEFACKYGYETCVPLSTTLQLAVKLNAVLVFAEEPFSSLVVSPVALPADDD